MAMIFELDRKAKAYLERIYEADAFSSARDNALSRLYRVSSKGYKSLKSLFSLFDEEDQQLFQTVEFKKLDPKELYDNPYYRFLVDHKDKLTPKDGFAFSHYQGNEVFLYDEISLRKSYESYSPSAYFPTLVEYPLYQVGGSNWMEVIPHEINTMAKPIEKAQGKVLLYGLGLGYALFMISNKKEVESVTVIEQDAQLIEGFSAKLLPLFPNKEKIRIERGDAIEYAKKHRNQEFDFLFADIWRDEVDGLPLYMQLQAHEGAAAINYYWIEESLLEYLRRYLIALIEEESNGYDDKDYPLGDGLFSSLHYLLKDKMIKTVEDIDGLLCSDNIRLIAKQLGE